MQTSHIGQYAERYRGRDIIVADAVRTENGENLITTFSSSAPANGHVWTHQDGAVVYKPSEEIGPAGALKFLGGTEVVGTVDEFGPNNLNQSWQVYDIEEDGTIHADWRDTLTRMDQIYTSIVSGGSRSLSVQQVMPGCMIAVSGINPGSTFTFPTAAQFTTEFGTQLRTGVSWRLTLSNDTANAITLAGGGGTTVVPGSIEARQNMELVVRRLGDSLWEVFVMQVSAVQPGSSPGDTIVPGTPNTYAANANLAQEAAALETARLIAGQSFDGTADVDIASTDLTDAADLVYETTSQALTNKDLTSGTNVFPTLNQNTTGTASNVTGTVAVANGGTGATALASNLLLKGGATVGTVTAGTDGQYLKQVAGVPSWANGTVHMVAFFNGAQFQWNVVNSLSAGLGGSIPALSGNTLLVVLDLKETSGTGGSGNVFLYDGTNQIGPSISVAASAKARALLWLRQDLDGFTDEIVVSGTTNTTNVFASYTHTDGVFTLTLRSDGTGGATANVLYRASVYFISYQV